MYRIYSHIDLEECRYRGVNYVVSFSADNCDMTETQLPSIVVIVFLSRTSPFAFIMRQSQNLFPPIVMTTSFMCHLSFGLGRAL